MVQEIIGGFLRGVFSICNTKYEIKTLRDLRKQPGIYCIENIITGDKYIGQSKNISLRLQEHLSCLRNNHHYYKKRHIPTILQKAWNKYGEENFKIYVLTYCNQEELNEKEIYWIKKLKTDRTIYGQGYNLTAGGAGTSHESPNKGKKQMNNGVIQKLVALEYIEYYKNLGFVFGLLPETKDKVNKNRPIRYGEDNPLHGRKQDPVIIEKRADGLRKWHSEHREEYKSMMKERAEKRRTSGRILIQPSSRTVQKCDSNNNVISEYKTITDAARNNNTTNASIMRWCNQNNKVQRNGYIWRFKDDTQI